MTTETKLKLSRAFHKVGFEIKKHSPAILIGAGVVGVVSSTVMACVATTKLKPILDDAKEKIEQIHDDETDGGLEEYTEKEAKKDLTKVYFGTGLKLVKLYAPSVILGTASITAIVASHRILTKRNLAISAAYATLDKGYKDYRKRVRKQFGEEVDKQLRYGIEQEDIETITVDEDGNEKTETKKTGVITYDGVQYSEFARIFDETNPMWQRNSEYNRAFLLQIEAWADQKLKSKGYLFLSEVYEALGFEETQASRVVGWIYDEQHPVGDNCVDFCLFDITKRGANSAFINGYEKSIILDFNVDGVIYDKLS